MQNRQRVVDITRHSQTDGDFSAAIGIVDRNQVVAAFLGDDLEVRGNHWSTVMLLLSSGHTIEIKGTVYERDWVAESMDD